MPQRIPDGTNSESAESMNIFDDGSDFDIFGRIREIEKKLDDSLPVAPFLSKFDETGVAYSLRFFRRGVG